MCVWGVLRNAISHWPFFYNGAFARNEFNKRYGNFQISFHDVNRAVLGPRQFDSTTVEKWLLGDAVGVLLLNE